MCDAFECAVLAKARDDPVRSLDERRHRVVADMIDGARRFDLFGRCAAQQQLVANVGADDVIDQRAHVPLGTRRRSPPVVGSDESQPPRELVVGHDEHLDRVSRRRHIRIVALCHPADKGCLIWVTRYSGLMTSSDSWTARPPINSRLTAAEAVLADLRAAIEKGDLAVGVRLPSEAAMATRYQVSRSVVREALRSAETLGLTRTQTGRGTFVVSDRPAHDLRIGQFSSRDLVEARPHFEVPAAGLAAQRRTEEHCAELRRLVQAMDHTTDQRQWVEHDAAFHGQIATASGNAVFAAVAESVRDALIRQ